MSSFAQMHIHYNVKIVLVDVVNLFATRTPTEAGAWYYSEGLVPQSFDVSFYIVKM